MNLPLVRLIVQSRMSSKRLPGKAMLALGGMPTVVLAARRAANTGRQVVVATSATAADDLLAESVAASGIACVRGSLDDVLGRFVQASADLPSTALVVRLTADNVFPDGEFVDRAIAAFAQSGQPYWSVRHPEDSLPYGMGVEITTVGMLRAAHRASIDAHDREHVTPWIRRRTFNTGAAGWLVAHAHLRCTLDDASDYRRLQQVFDGIGEPHLVPWKDLCARLGLIENVATANSVALRAPAPLRFCLGTAQLGTEYGVVNQTGQPSVADAISMVASAINSGVLSLDTARAYGVAEFVVGQALRCATPTAVHVVTKLDPLAHLADDAPDGVLFDAIDASVTMSCQKLGVAILDTMLLHRWSHFRGFGGRLWHHLEELRRKGVVRRLGASVYSPADAIDALQAPSIEHLQLPFNLLDARLISGGIEAALARRQDVTIHVRSVFLQGLLVSPPELWPNVVGVDATTLVASIDALASEMGFKSRAQLCVSYVLAHDWAHRLVIGSDTQGQLRENLRLFEDRPLNEDECDRVRRHFPALPDELLDPSRWTSSAKR